MRTTAVVMFAAAMAVSACKKDKPEAEAAEIEPAGTVDKTPQEEKKAPDPALVERGAYIANVMMCGVCHTPLGEDGMPDKSRAFAGGFEVKEPFGTWRSPNITPDMKTGIGPWTDEQIIAAVREGVGKGAQQMYPIMPYPYFHVLSDSDAKALVAFLRSLPPVENAVAPNTDLQLPKPKMPKAAGAEPDRSDPVKYGEYLAGLMHCAMCHTPMDMKTMQPDQSKAWAGGFPMEIPEQFEPMMGSGTIYAANITQDPETGIGSWSQDDIAKALTTGKRPDGSAIRGPMGLFSMVVFPKMTAEDVNAVAAFVKQIPAVSHKVPEGDFKPAPAPPQPPAQP